ncbi:hypothetical protein FKW77_006405 [Venturia effusa]|uniref:Asteroid domain-containing protein n=1 Tax=Venturia effusa TaxID=50376 RepID=A0A517LIY5_9PEZI|nr:hypothetical protein FKW77_006405 [Venturia effusa]
MGIPKLVSMLQPWASRHQLSNTHEAGEASIFLRHADEARGDIRDAVGSLGPTAREAIIDGPALSYHAYGIAVASRNNASHALDALPSYREVNAIVLDCLSLLESYGFRVVAVFFDGILPSSKEPTRFERLNSSRKQLERFRSNTPSLIAEPGKGRKLTPRLPFSFSRGQDKLKALPALPFLVPAAIEALNESRYRFQTRVVPAEADVYCAKYASLHGGGTIFTSDSDLLVYDMTEKSNIVLFKDIELIGNNSVHKRISEWIHLAIPNHVLHPTTFSNAVASGTKTIDFADKVLDMYLPFSIDDPMRATCWNLSIPIRQMAYSILKPGKHITDEWTRRGQRIGEKKVDHLSAEEVVDRLQTQMNLLSSVRGQIDDQVLVWRFMGLYSICAELVDEEKLLPKREVLVKLLKGSSGGKDWGLVHLGAQMEAVLYSWRMLWQCCRVQQALREKGTLNPDIDDAVNGISGILNSMPGIADLFDPTLLLESAVESALEYLWSVLGIEDPGVKPEEREDVDGFRAANRKRKKRRKEELKNKLPVTKAAKVPKTSNLFDVLGVER